VIQVQNAAKKYREDLKKGFDILYESEECVWGLQADSYLDTFIKHANRGLALDIGCGEGRHSLYLAQKGFKVDALDLSESAIRKLENLIRQYDMKESIKPVVGDARDIDLGKDKYELILLSFVLPFLRKSDIDLVIAKSKIALKDSGCIYISALTIEDIEYKTYRESQKEVDERTFYSPGLMCSCYFFAHGELKKMFSEFEIIDYTEATVKLRRPPYSHSFCLLFARKRVG